VKPILFSSGSFAEAAAQSQDTDALGGEISLEAGEQVVWKIKVNGSTYQNGYSRATGQSITQS